jgi:hypothetical protein
MADKTFHRPGAGLDINDVFDHGARPSIRLDAGGADHLTPGFKIARYPLIEAGCILKIRRQAGIEQPLPEGWVSGRLGQIGDMNLGNKNKTGDNTRGKKIYNNGIKHAYFLPDNVPEGWVSGKMLGYQGGTGAMKKKERNDNGHEKT